MIFLFTFFFYCLHCCACWVVVMDTAVLKWVVVVMDNDVHYWVVVVLMDTASKARAS